MQAFFNKESQIFEGLVSLFFKTRTSLKKHFETRLLILNEINKQK